MVVAIAGAHGKIAMRLTALLATGRVRIDAAPFRGQVPRDDVAAVIARLVHDPRFSGRVFYVNSGDRLVEPALEDAISV